MCAEVLNDSYLRLQALTSHTHTHTESQLTYTRTHTNSPIARCSLWPKHWSLVQLLMEIAFTMFDPLSVVIHAIFSSSKLQDARASFSPCAKISPLWSSGKKEVCRHLLFMVKSIAMKWTVRLMYGYIVRLDHKSVVAEK